MSASEKLKALDSLPQALKLIDALPQIVAVVEAAERHAGALVPVPAKSLRAALDALEEALS